ncbi:MAG: hypothetical protein ABI151_11005 [Chitinophagaceae bacterium]
MELDFDNDEFESFLKQKADQYKMYPSERVWKGIAFIQHSRTRLITIGGSLLMISVFLVLGGHLLTDRNGTANNLVPEPVRVITSLSSANSSSKLEVTPENARRSVMVATNLARRNEIIDAESGEEKVRISSDRPLNLSRSQYPPVNASQTSEKKVPHPRIAIADAGSQVSEKVGYGQESDENTVAIKEEKTSPASVIKMTAEGAMTGQVERNVQGTKIGNLPVTIDEEQVSDKTVNWLQEIAAIKLTSPDRNPFNVQFYFSPMVSYRKLVDNTGMKTGTASNSIIQLGTINRFVDHKPAIGVELGSNVLYSPVKNLTIKTGVQLNYSRYTIKAFKSYVEKASIALNSMTQHTRDTMVSYTTVRNFNGYSPEVLENQYLQLSVPIGAELLVLGKKKLQFIVAGTVQPTYLLFNDSYLLSSDYEHYTKEPSLVRRWNIHTSAEAFISYKIGSLRWQIGPQFRYQMFSSYHDQYPIKEYLMEYGIKFGLSKTLK